MEGEQRTAEQGRADSGWTPAAWRSRKTTLEDFWEKNPDEGAGANYDYRRAVRDVEDGEPPGRAACWGL